MIEERKGCYICRNSLFENCYASCEICGKDYHILCAFLAGFDLHLKEGHFFGGPDQLPNLNCCR